MPSNKSKSITDASRSIKPHELHVKSPHREFSSSGFKFGSPMSINLSKPRPKTGKIGSQKANSIDDYGWSNNNVFSSFLRHPNNKKMSKYYTSKETNWIDRFAIPFSEFNEVVFKKYKVSFDNM